MVVYALVAIVGATMDLGLIWGIADTFNGLMSIPNLIALFLLSGTVIKLVKEYKKFEEYIYNGIGYYLYVRLYWFSRH